MLEKTREFRQGSRRPNRALVSSLIVLLDKESAIRGWQPFRARTILAIADILSNIRRGRRKDLKDGKDQDKLCLYWSL